MTIMGDLNLGPQRGKGHEGDGQKAMEGHEMTRAEQTSGGASDPREVVLINSHNNPVAAMDEAAFSGEWKWHRTAPEWRPGNALPVEAGQIEALVVFAAKYQEEEISQLCDGIRQDPVLGAIPILVAVDQYQMPLANRERTKPNTDFIVIPLEEHSLREHIARARKEDADSSMG